MKYIKKYEKIVNELIKKDFPSLQDQKIIFKEKKAKWRAHVNYYPWGMVLYASEKLREFPIKSVRRILFHELCHLEIFKEWGCIKTLAVYPIYNLFPSIRKRVESEANILMIKKGRGKEVLEVARKNAKEGLKYSLSEEEIRLYIKKYKFKD